MKYYLDTEFHEFEKQGINTIELISIGIVAEDGREYYAICNEFDIGAAWDNEWLRENVLHNIFQELIGGKATDTPSLFDFNKSTLDMWLMVHGKSRERIRDDIKSFTGIGRKREDVASPITRDIDHDIRFYAYYADYDWVVFCWLFGRMIDLPALYPMYCRDLKQLLDVRQDELQEEYNSIEYIEELANTMPPEPIKDHSDYPKQDNEHNALDDARWNMKLHNFLNNLK